MPERAGATPRRGLGLAVALALVTTARSLAPQEPPASEPPPRRGSLFIRNLDALWPGDGPARRGVSVLVRDGRIAAIGDLRPPPGVPILDGAGHTAIPGLVDTHSHLALDVLNETGDAIVPEVRMADVIDPSRREILNALAAGVTTALLLHGSARPIGGQGATVKLRRGARDPEELLIEGAPRTIKFALGENVLRQDPAGTTARPLPATTAGLARFFDSVFAGARAYREERDRGGRARDARQEALLDVLAGRLAVHAHAYRANEMLMLLSVAARNGFRVALFTHAMEAYRIAPELAAAGTAASVFMDNWGYKVEASNGTRATVGILRRAGVLTSLNSDLPDLQPLLLHDAVKAVRFGGLSREDALRLITLDPATQLGLAHRIGSVSPGKDADLVLLSGDPFDAFTRVDATIVEGIVQYRHPPSRAVPRAIPPPDRPIPVCHVDGGAPVGLVRGATVHPVDRAPIPGGVVVWRDDEILCVGRPGRIHPPTGSRVLEAKGRHVYPGLIDPHTRLGLVANDGVLAGREDREAGDWNPTLDPVHGLTADDPALALARASGVTAVLTGGQGGIVPGTGAVLRLSGRTAWDLAFRRGAVLLVNFPPVLGDPAAPEWLDRGPAASLARLLEDTVAADLRPYTTGRRPVFFTMRRGEDFPGLFRLLDRVPRVRATVLANFGAPAFASELAGRGIPVVVTGAWLADPSPGGGPTTGAEVAALLHAAGVRIAFSGSRPALQDFANVRNLADNAARAVAYGLPPEAALEAVTLGAAQALGVEHSLGSLTAGKAADLIVTDGDPLQLLTRVHHVIVRGQVTSLRTRDDELAEIARPPSGPP